MLLLLLLLLLLLTIFIVIVIVYSESLPNLVNFTVGFGDVAAVAVIVATATAITAAAAVAVVVTVGRRLQDCRWRLHLSPCPPSKEKIVAIIILKAHRFFKPSKLKWYASTSDECSCDRPYGRENVTYKMFPSEQRDLL